MGATCSITGAGAAEVSLRVEYTCSITGAGAVGVTVGSGATYSITVESSDGSDISKSWTQGAPTCTPWSARSARWKL